MSLMDLYRELVMKHANGPVNFRRVEDATVNVPGRNPLCGDALELFVTVDDETVTDVSFQGTGCAISMASASMLAELTSGRPEHEISTLIEQVNAMLQAPAETPIDPALEETPIAALAAVRTFPSRVKCATLAWQAMEAALDGNSQTVTTE